MKNELSFRCWQISLQLKLEFIQLSFLPSEIYVKTVLLSLVSFFPSAQMFFFSRGVHENSDKLDLQDKAV